MIANLYWFCIAIEGLILYISIMYLIDDIGDLKDAYFATFSK